MTYRLAAAGSTASKPSTAARTAAAGAWKVKYSSPTVLHNGRPSVRDANT